MTIPESLAKDQLDQILRDAMELVGRESPSTSKAHLDETLDGLLALTRERLGEPDHFERLPHDEKGDVAVLTYNGAQDANVLLVGITTRCGPWARSRNGTRRPSTRTRIRASAFPAPASTT